MANWNNPENTTSYLDVLDELKSRDVDALTLLRSTGSNIPTGAIRFVRQSNNKVDIQEWSGSAWITKIVSIASGGFDSGGASLGTMASQNSDNVTITGGSVASSTLSGDISLGRIPDLPATIIGSEEFNVARIPDLSASKINSGQFDKAQIPNLSADKINSGAFGVDQIPNLSADKINSGTFGDSRIPSLNADKIDDGVFDAARIPTFSSANMPTGTFIGYKLVFNDTEFSTSSTSYQATPLTISYTAQQSNNKLLLTLYRLISEGFFGGGDRANAEFRVQDENGVVISDAIGQTEYNRGVNRTPLDTILYEIDNPGLGNYTYTLYLRRGGDNRPVRFIKGAFIIKEIRG